MDENFVSYRELKDYSSSWAIFLLSANQKEFREVDKIENIPTPRILFWQHTPRIHKFELVEENQGIQHKPCKYNIKQTLINKVNIPFL